MNEDYELTNLGDMWRVNFKRRSFTREFATKEIAARVIEADKVYSRAEAIGLYTPQTTEAVSQDIATKLRKTADDLEQVGIGAFTLREFRYVASILDGKPAG